MKKLYLGSGSRTNEKQSQGFVCVDFDARYKPDVLWDMEIFPWPFEDDSVEYIEAHHVIEHQSDVDAFMCELWRISKDGAKISLKYPHFSRVLASGFGMNDKHKSAVPMRLLDRYSRKFTYDRIRFSWMRFDIPPHPDSKYKGKWFTKLANKIINAFLNLNVTFSDRIFAYWFGGVDDIEVLSTVHKKGIKWEQPLQRKFSPPKD
ncbi:MAG: hypothetical protein A3H02_02525 [Candidatus Niyogibacteria bacterium RIFCSPLOWO2_12_FULL_41_13]|uniref:Methyltransferase type 11 domain-containing protein n=1 Tax=Candidatus Niyogibacteria bacterium RIFCSPLOWO2_12_FULL_41_13 TaxID=1801726 RepID=A0A1G2F0I7_9BACT|nr:MAG: hypothetical protein A3H02_02525 [Candidatus Niyogibacteria bacterium RIFCSPLOWO2_12_FULL_41_13]